MNTNILMGILTSSMVLFSNVQNHSSFEYKFQIKTNSFNPLDDAAGYYYKEQLIDKVEYQLFTIDESQHTYYIINHLEDLKFSDDVEVNYQMGTICITIGEGKGKTIKGNFRKNECDEAVIREKYYILELFK